MMESTDKFYFFHRNARESLYARYGQWNKNHISKVKNNQSSVLPLLHVKYRFFFFMTTANFLNLTTAPTCDSQATMPWQPPMFLYLCILIPYSYWSSSHLAVPPDSHHCNDLCHIQPVFTRYFQLIQLTFLYIEHYCQLWCSISDPIGRKQSQGLWDNVYKVYSSIL